MTKGIIYVMTTAVSGLVKIGKTGTKNYGERMRFLEANGYYNVAGLKRFFAIELEEYDDKESLLHEIFSKHQVGNSELFALDQEVVQQLLLSFEGSIVYPERINKEKAFDTVATSRKQSALFSFYRKGLRNGDTVHFIPDQSITAVIVGEREVDYEGQVWKLSPLTYKLFEIQGKLNSSGAYQGANYWQFDNKKLKDMPDVSRE
ncbi:MAG: GIY-YIG nuclease family protein [Candidatus Saccharimonadales bacterium]